VQHCPIREIEFDEGTRPMIIELIVMNMIRKFLLFNFSRHDLERGLCGSDVEYFMGSKWRDKGGHGGR